MSNTITVTVTQKNIDDGKTCSAHTCAIALAFVDMGFGCVSVGAWAATVAKGERAWLASDIRKVYRLTTEASQFIEQFDNGETVEPFSFIATEVNHS